MYTIVNGYLRSNQHVHHHDRPIHVRLFLRMQRVDNCRYRSCHRHHVNWDRVLHIDSPRTLDKQMLYNTKQLMQGWWTETITRGQHILTNYTFCLIFQHHHNYYHHHLLLFLYSESECHDALMIHKKKYCNMISLICNYDIYLWLLSSIESALASQAH